jgi:hypothetical protein
VDRLHGAASALGNVGLLLLGLLVLSPALGELLLRAGITVGIARLRHPGLYADPYADDDYWKLHHRWQFKDNLQPAGTVHPRLGWAPRTTKRNPLGIIAEPGYEVDFERPGVLFFGDSFVAGRGPIPERIPQQLDSMLPVKVYNYGVAGYGVDQIFLRFQETHPLFEQPTILFGILTTDVDRCLLSLRTGQKPRFVLRDGELDLRGLPIDLDPARYLASHPPRLRSYFAALVLRQARLWSGGGDGREIPYRRMEKQELNRRILDGVVAEAGRRNLVLYFVLFYDPGEIRMEGWREIFLREEMERLELPYLDTKPLILRVARESSRPVADFYRTTDAHPSAFGNRIVAEALERDWRGGRMGRGSPASDSP